MKRWQRLLEILRWPIVDDGFERTERRTRPCSNYEPHQGHPYEVQTWQQRRGVLTPVTCPGRP